MHPLSWQSRNPVQLRSEVCFIFFFNATSADYVTSWLRDCEHRTQLRFTCDQASYFHAQQTHSVILVFMQAMVLNPEVQKCAQAEIDRIVGSERLPDFGDRASMPYVEAVLRETLRFHPISPLSKALGKFMIPLMNILTDIPHAAVNDDVYDGYLIPKGEQMP